MQLSSMNIAVYCFIFFVLSTSMKWKGEVLLFCYLSEFSLLDFSGKEEIGIEEYSFSQSTLEQVEFWPLLIISFFLCYKNIAMVNNLKNSAISFTFWFLPGA